jgi:hypothetical protein
VALISGAFINTPNVNINLDHDNIISTSTEIISTSTIKENISAEVKAEFADTPIMQKIAFCESRNRQFNPDGTVVRGIVNSKDVGIFQINERYHLSDSKKMGMDIHTVVGNMQYARFLYESQGTSPWDSSKPCWGSSENLAMK